MEFDTVKKNHKKEIIVGGIAVLGIVSAITFVGTRAKYKTTESIKLVQGNVVYKSSDLRVVAIKTSEDGTNYTDVDDVPASGYTLNTTNSICRVYDGTTTSEGAPKDENVTIEYINGKINFKGITKHNTRCYLYFDKINGITVDDIIAANNPKSETPDFTNVATTDEGVYSVSDGMYGGTSYYWRGAATTNYVKFAGFCWRAIRVNGDGSLRLIYDGTTCHANGTSTEDSIAVTGQAYNSNYNRSEYAGYTYTSESQRGSTASSNLKTQNETWYNVNLSSYTSKIADGKFCNDRNIGLGYNWSSQPNNTFYYAGYDRAGVKSSNVIMPILSCDNESDLYTLKIGAITMDEVIMAGAKWSTPNRAYYLYNNNWYWTISPYSWYYINSSSRNVSVFVVRYDGQLINYRVDDFNLNVRPVINLKAETLFKTGGDGTQNNPYETL